MADNNFIKDMAKKTGITADQAADVLKSDEAKKIAADLGKKVGLDESKTKDILDTVSGVISDGKIKNLFG